MNDVLMVCVIVVSGAIVIAVVFLVRTLWQMQKTAREAEILLKSLNKELGIFFRITDGITDFVNHFSSPWRHLENWGKGFVSRFFGKKGSEGETEDGPHE